MTPQGLQQELHHLEEVSVNILGYAPSCFKAAQAAAEAGDLNTCRRIIDSAIPVFSQADLGYVSAPLIGIHRELGETLTAA